MTASVLVSVVLPTHNRASLLGRAIASVLDQTHRELELIVVDDASTDDTAEIVKRFEDPRLRYLRIERNAGPAGARNAGIRAASGDLVSFQDDDDEWLPRKLERQVAALSASPPEVGLVLCSFRRIEQDMVWHVGGEGYFRQLDFNRYVRDRDWSLIATPNWLLRKSLLDRVGLFDEQLRTLEDWELALRIFKACEVRHLDEELWIQYQLRPPENALAMNERLLVEGFPVLLDKHGADWSGGTVSRYCCHAARFHALDGRWPEARAWLRRALRSNPLSWRAWSLLLGSLAGDRAVHGMVSGWSRMLGARRRLIGLFYDHPVYRGRYENRGGQP